MANVKGHIVLNTKPYMLAPNGDNFETPSYSRLGGGVGQSPTTTEFEHSNFWKYWGQGLYLGTGVIDWRSVGPNDRPDPKGLGTFRDGYGLDLTNENGFSVALELGLTPNDPTTGTPVGESDLLNTAGYVGFPVGKTRCIFHGKTDGTVHWTADATGFLGGLKWQTPRTQAATFGGGHANERATSWGHLKSKIYVGTTEGRLLSTDTTDGATYLQIASAYGAPVSATLSVGAGNAWLDYTATGTGQSFGAAGNDITLDYVVAGLNTALSVAVIGTAIKVYVATDGAGAIASTATQVKTAVNALPAAAALVTVTDHAPSTGAALVVDIGETHLAGGVGGPSYVLGSFQGLLYVGYKDAVWNYDGLTWSPSFAGKISGTPIMGAVGNRYLYFLTAGPDANLYETDGTSVAQVAEITSDFSPQDMVFHKTLWIGGKARDIMTGFTEGMIWRLEKDGLTPVFVFGDKTKDYGIRNLLVDGDNLYWGANQYTGIGVYDETLDILTDVQSGFYVGSVTSTADNVTGVVSGLVHSQGYIYAGIAGKGIYRQNLPGRYQMVSSIFDDLTRNILKTWGVGEVHYSALTAGQSVNLRVIKNDSGVQDLWATDTTVASTRMITPAPNFPTLCQAPFLQFVVDGNAGGAPLTIHDIAIGFKRTPELVKRRWTLLVDVAGSMQAPLVGLDGLTYTGRDWSVMLGELNALANKACVFEDIDGSLHNVFVEPISGRGAGRTPRVSEVYKHIAPGTTTISDARFAIHLTLVEI